MLLDIEIAKTYYIAPMNSESKYYVGGMDQMNYLAYLMHPGDLVATTGISGVECTLFVTWDDDVCERMIEEMRQLIKREKQDLIQLQKLDTTDE